MILPPEGVFFNIISGGIGLFLSLIRKAQAFLKYCPGIARKPP